jgi:hypothetical protein
MLHAVSRYVVYFLTIYLPSTYSVTEIFSVEASVFHVDRILDVLCFSPVYIHALKSITWVILLRIILF